MPSNMNTNATSSRHKSSGHRRDRRSQRRDSAEDSDISNDDNRNQKNRRESQDPPRNRRNETEEPESTVNESRKRKRDTQKLQDIFENGSAQKKAKESWLVPYKKAARYVPRGISPFCNLVQSFQIGMRVECGGDPDEALDDIDEADQKEAKFVYNGVIKLLPQLPEYIQHLEETEDIDTLHNLLNFIEENARLARTDDVGSLRYTAMCYIPKKAGYPDVSPTNRNKSERGFAHVTSARLLCPRSMRDEFDKDQEMFRRKVHEGEITIAASDWPSFLYPEDVYNPDAMDEGLLRGPFLLSCFRHVFTGPRTAMKPTPGPAAGKKSMTDIHNITTLTPRYIAYIAVLARFILNAKEEWDIEDGTFDAAEFFKNIVDLFDEENGDPDWSEATLEWWNYQVFGTKSQHTRASETAHAKRDSGVSKLAAQRAAPRTQKNPANNED